MSDANIATKFSVPVLFTENIDREPKLVWTEYGESTNTTLRKGWSREPGRRALSEDMIWDKDVRITLRDGVSLLADVFRPASSTDCPVPAIMPWSPYGKTGTGETGSFLRPLHDLADDHRSSSKACNSSTCFHGGSAFPLTH
jgi:predicted acyl esterase